ncbi:hypothetical protein K7432_002332 [Basidiobolus ranarum]|uniref:Uncharacterized protein n=1 Tax=Basidiobolus ranarum TaxID=34480 RepID=A0ABR2X1Q0_9FUNG
MMRYGYLEGKSDLTGQSHGYFSKIITPPHLTKIGLSSNHNKFGFTGLRKSILNWMGEHQELRIELTGGVNEASTRRGITFEFTTLYQFAYSPSRCLIRPTKNEDYASPIPGSPEYYSNTRILVTESGKSLGELLPIIKLCWKSDPRVKFILNHTEPGTAPSFILPTNLAISLTLETCPTYKSSDSIISATRQREPPAYSEINHDEPRPLQARNHAIIR